MSRPTMTVLIFSLLVLGGAEARSLTPAKASLLANSEPKVPEKEINPPLKDVKSDKKFFGPPFPADYPDDKRPVIDQSVMNKLKSPDQPYPALQSKDKFDSDYVKDENSDKGAWQAQFEYDALRKKLAEKQAGVKRAQDRSDREGKDADSAQRDDDDAGRKVDDAQKDVDGANKGDKDANGKDAKTAEDFDGPPSDEKLKELKKAVEAAEERLEKQKKAFEECERQLAEAKKDLEDLKAKQKELEGQLAAETKLWVEQNQKQKTVKLNLKKSKDKAVSEKTTAAQEKLTAANKVKAAAEKELAKQKAENEKAQSSLKKEKADLKKAQDQLDAAKTKLQKLHGYKPAEGMAPSKSGAQMTSAVMAVLTIVGMIW